MADTYIPYSYEYMLGDGVATIYPVHFPYMHSSHVHVYVGGEETTDFVFINPGSIELATAPAAGVVIKIQRIAPADEPVVDFEDGATLGELELDSQTIQLLFLIQENIDGLALALTVDENGNWDAKGRRIINLGDPIDPKDATNKWYVDDQIQTILGDAIDALNKAIADYEKIIQLLDELAYLQTLGSNTSAFKRSWQQTTELTAGSILTLPVPYWPTRSMMDIRLDNAPCIDKAEIVDGTIVDYQYEEVGAKENLSYQIRIGFDVEAGRIWSMWVLPSYTEKLYEEYQELLAETQELLVETKEYSDQAIADMDAISKQYLVSFQNLYNEAVNNITVYVNETLLPNLESILDQYTDEKKEELDEYVEELKLELNGNWQSTYFPTSSYEAGTNLFTPLYTPGGNYIMVYFNGIKVESGTYGQYDEGILEDGDTQTDYIVLRDGYGDVESAEEYFYPIQISIISRG